MEREEPTLVSTEKSRDHHPRIYSQIKADVVFNRLPLGRQIQVKELGRKFGVSDTPIREVLFALAHEEYIEYVPNKGFFMRPMSAERFSDQYEFAFLVLQHSIEIRRGVLTVKGLRSPENFARGATDEQDIVDVCALFIEQVTERIAMLSGNLMMASAIRRFTDSTAFVRRLELEQVDAREEKCKAMLEVIDALAEGNGQAAIDKLRHRLHRKKRIIIDLVKEGNNRGLSALSPTQFD